MDVSFDEEGPRLSKEDLLGFQEQAGIRFPKEYQEFLLQHNGGRPSPSVFAYSRDGNVDSGMVDWFLSIHNAEYDSLKDYNTTYKPRLPGELIPIAHDPGGNLICLVWSGPLRYRIYFWDHDEEAEEGEPPTDRNLYFVADSLQEFLNALTEL
jgi:SMI1 / KNR4 family (SUKH-1)